MAGFPQFGPAPADDPLEPAHRAFGAAFERLDVAAARAAIGTAVDAGVPPTHIYTRVVRPFAGPTDAPGAGPRAEQRRALARSLAHAAVADLAGAHPGRGDGTAPRAAAVLVPGGLLGELDATLLADVLEPQGWHVRPIALGRDADAVAEEVAALGAELVLVPASSPEHVLAARRVCSALRWLAAPPLVLACALEPSGEPRDLAADAFVAEPGDLAGLVRRRLGGHDGAPPWGVRLTRQGPGLLVAPVGVLDAPAALRLRDVVESRRALYHRIVVDLTELLRADPDGLLALAHWHDESDWGGDVALLAAEPALKALARAGLGGRLPVV